VTLPSVLNRRRKRVAAVLRIAGLGACSLVANAHAGEVNWQAPDGCTVDEFTTRVELLLGRPLAEIKDSDFRVVVEEERPGQWRLKFTLVTASGEQGTRELRGTSCADVTRAGAVPAAMALQMTAADEAPVTREENKPADRVPTTNSPRPNASAERAPEVLSTPQADSEVGTVVAVALAGDMNLLGAPALGAGLDLGLRWDSIWFGLSGTWLPPVAHEVAPGRGGQFGLAAGDAWGCWRSDGSVVRVFACAHYEIGALHGQGSGNRVTARWTKTALWQAIRPELGLALPFSESFEAQLRLGASVALTRPEFVLDGDLLVLKPDRLTARASVGVVYIP
jgi:hypothetical protein